MLLSRVCYKVCRLCFPKSSSCSAVKPLCCIRDHVSSLMEAIRWPQQLAPVIRQETWNPVFLRGAEQQGMTRRSLVWFQSHFKICFSNIEPDVWLCTGTELWCALNSTTVGVCLLLKSSVYNVISWVFPPDPSTTNHTKNFSRVGRWCSAANKPEQSGAES